MLCCFPFFFLRRTFGKGKYIDNISIFFMLDLRKNILNISLKMSLFYCDTSYLFSFRPCLMITPACPSQVDLNWCSIFHIFLFVRMIEHWERWVYTWEASGADGDQEWALWTGCRLCKQGGWKCQISPWSSPLVCEGRRCSPLCLREWVEWRVCCWIAKKLSVNTPLLCFFRGNPLDAYICRQMLSFAERSQCSMFISEKLCWQKQPTEVILKFWSSWSPVFIHLFVFFSQIKAQICVDQTFDFPHVHRISCHFSMNLALAFLTFERAPSRFVPEKVADNLFPWSRMVFSVLPRVQTTPMHWSSKPLHTRNYSAFFQNHFMAWFIPPQNCFSGTLRNLFWVFMVFRPGSVIHHSFGVATICHQQSKLQKLSKQLGFCMRLERRAMLVVSLLLVWKWAKTVCACLAQVTLRVSKYKSLSTNMHPFWFVVPQKWPICAGIFKQSWYCGYFGEPQLPNGKFLVSHNFITITPPFNLSDNRARIRGSAHETGLVRKSMNVWSKSWREFTTHVWSMANGPTARWVTSMVQILLVLSKLPKQCWLRVFSKWGSWPGLGLARVWRQMEENSNDGRIFVK